MKIQEKANYIKTLYLYVLAQEKIDNPNATDEALKELARTSLKANLAKRISIGDGIQKNKVDGGGVPTGNFEINISALVKGLRPFQVQGLSINGSTWTLIDTKDGNPKEDIQNLIFESPDTFSAIRLYDPISGVYSNVFKLA